METKTCSKCKETKPLSEFGKNKQSKTGYGSWCKTCISKAGKRHRESPSGIYSSFKGRTNFYKKKPVSISREGFIEWYNSQEKKCVYCGIVEDELHNVGDPQNDFCNRLTIDCVKNGLGYSEGNLVLACKRCNNIKNDFFTFEEMREIAMKYVRPRWNVELAKNKL